MEILRAWLSSSNKPWRMQCHYTRHMQRSLQMLEQVRRYCPGKRVIAGCLLLTLAVLQYQMEHLWTDSSVKVSLFIPHQGHVNESMTLWDAGNYYRSQFATLVQLNETQLASPQLTYNHHFRFIMDNCLTTVTQVALLG